MDTILQTLPQLTTEEFYKLRCLIENTNTIYEIDLQFNEIKSNCKYYKKYHYSKNVIYYNEITSLDDFKEFFVNNNYCFSRMRKSKNIHVKLLCKSCKKFITEYLS